MILRWLEILASFDFTVRHRKGTLNGNADSLSWAPHAALPTPAEEKILVSDEGAVITALQPPPGFTLEEMREHQRRDEHLQDIQKWKNELPTEAEKQLLSPDQRKLLTFLPAFQQDATSELWAVVSQEGGCRSPPIVHTARPPTSSRRSRPPVPGTCGNHGYRPLLQEEGVHAATGPRSP